MKKVPAYIIQWKLCAVTTASECPFVVPPFIQFCSLMNNLLSPGLLSHLQADGPGLLCLFRPIVSQSTGVYR